MGSDYMLKLQPGLRSVTLLWESVPGANMYKIYRARSFRDLAYTSPIATVYTSGFDYWIPYTDTELQPGNTYWYGVSTLMPIDGWDTLHNIDKVTTCTADNPDIPTSTGDIITNFTPSLVNLNPFYVNQTAFIEYNLSRYADIRIIICDTSRHIVLIRDLGTQTAGSSFRWGGVIWNNIEGERAKILAPPGSYLVSVVATDSSGAQDSISIHVAVH